MNAQAIVEKLGFRPSEARIYVALIGLQEATVSELARKSNIPRTTAQGILEDLHKQGLVNFYMIKSRKMWCSESPRKLLARHQQIQKQLSDAIPALERIRPQKQITNKTFNLEGRHGATFLCDDILVSREAVAILGDPGVLIRLLGAAEWSKFLSHAAQTLPSLRILTNSDELAVETPAMVKLRKCAAARIPQETNTALVLYGDKSASISAIQEVVAVSISQNAASTTLLLGMFDCAWESCQK
jgi:predicted DNA-binding transcriptional regulator